MSRDAAAGRRTSARVEGGVAATKACTTQLTALDGGVVAWARARGAVGDSGEARLVGALAEVAARADAEGVPG